MPIIKKKSLVVALVSSLVLTAVLALTLLTYAVYLELKDKGLKAEYEHALKRSR